jgi:hypothetical protein
VRTPGRQDPGDQFGEASARVRGALGRLEDHRVPGSERGTEQAARDRDRVVPRCDRGDQPARLVHHQVRGRPAALQAASAVQRTQLGVLAQGAGAGVDPAAGVRDRLPHLAGGQLGQLAGRGLDRRRGGVQEGTALGRTGARPFAGRLPGVGHRGVHLGGVGHRHRAHQGAVGGIVDLDAARHQGLLESSRLVRFMPTPRLVGTLSDPNRRHGAASLLG